MSGRSKPPAVNSSQIGSQASAPFIAAFMIPRQIDVNDRVIYLQGCGQGLTTMKRIQSPILNNLDARNIAEAWIQKDWSQSLKVFGIDPSL